MTPETQAKLLTERVKQLDAYAKSLEARAQRVRTEIAQIQAQLKVATHEENV